MRSIVFSALSILLLSADSLIAAPIIGGSELLTPSSVSQLETWLGQGPLQLTKIYSKQPGSDNGAAFHAAVDGKGPTIAILEVLGSRTQLVGGYNPVSWNASINNWYLTPDDVDRTSFIFNLTTGDKRDQQLGAGFGIYQAYNVLDYGPTFGGGADMAVFGPGLTSGYFLSATYAPLGSVNIVGDAQVSRPTIGRIEVFTFAPDTSNDGRTTEAPEPASLLAWGMAAALAGIAFARRGKAAQERE